jgi:predicted O-methyltransferase YrrM
MKQLEDYILSRIDGESDLLRRLSRDAHVNLLQPRMLSGHLQGRILKMLCRMIRPRSVLEIGTYTAYATLCMAEALEEGALIHTVEINDEREDFIRKYLDQTPLKEKIRLHIGDAMDIVPALNETFDLAYIDADKRMYSAYFDLIVDRVRPQGFIIADNTLWNGKVLEETRCSDAQTAGIRAFNDKIAQDRRIEKVILPVRDGITVMYRL